MFAVGISEVYKVYPETEYTGNCFELTVWEKDFWMIPKISSHSAGENQSLTWETASYLLQKNYQKTLNCQNFFRLLFYFSKNTMICHIRDKWTANQGAE